MEPSIEQLLRQGREALGRRDYAAALAAFEQILEQHPDFADVQHLCGLCLSLLGQPVEALQAFDRALELNDSYVEAHLNRAVTLNELGRFEEARSAFARAGEADLGSNGQIHSAVSARLANAHADVGDVYAEAGHAAEAAEQYRRALELRPEFLDVRNRLAQVLLDQGDATAAREELERVLESNARFISARLNLGLALFRLGDRVGAARQWEQVLSQTPDEPRARAYLSMLERDAVAHDPDGA